MVDARKIYAVDMFQGVLDELERSAWSDRIVYVRNNGSDFPGVADGEIDFLFTFGCFVHIEADAIAKYLAEIARVLKPTTGRSVVQFANKQKKIAAENKGFGHMTPDLFVALVASSPLQLVRMDDDLLEHSTIAELKLP